MNPRTKKTRIWLWIGIPSALAVGSFAGLWFYGRPLIEKILVQALPEVQASLSRAAGFPIHMGQLVVDRDGLRPILRAQGLRLGLLHKDASTESDCRPGAEWTIENLELSFDLWQAFVQRQIRLTRVTARGVQGAFEWDSKKKKWTAPSLESLDSTPKTDSTATLLALGALRVENAEFCTVQGTERRRLKLESAELSTRATAAFTEGNLIGTFEAKRVSLTAPEYPARGEEPGLLIPEAKLQWSARVTPQSMDHFEIQDGAVTLNDTHWRLKKNTVEIAKPMSFAQLKRVLPRGLIPRSTDTYLATAILGAELTSGQVTLNDLTGTDWRVQLTAKSVGFQFAETWPKIENAEITLELDPSGVRFEVPRAESLGVPASAGRGELRNEHLTISLQARPDQAALLAWIEKGPFKDLAPQVLKTLTPLSGAELSIEASVPLEEDTQKPTVAKIGVQGLKLNVVSPLQETIERLQSRLVIESQGTQTRVKWSETQGTLQGNDWTSTGHAALSSAKNGRSEIEAQWVGIVQWNRLKEVLPQLAPLPASGQIPLKATVKLEQTSIDPQWYFETSVQSNLSGLSLDAPPPLNKAASSPWESTFRASGTEQELAHVEITTPPFESRIHWEEQALRTQTRVTAEQFSATAWQNWWSQNSAKWKVAGEKSADRHELEIRTPEFLFSTQRWHKAHLTLTWSDAAKKLRVTSQEAVGDLTLEGEGKQAQLKLRFDPLQVQVPEPATTETKADGEEPAPDDWNWDEIPELHAFIENLSYGSDRLGTLKIDTKKNDQTLEVTQAELRGPHLLAKIERGFQKWGLAAKSSWRGSLTLDDFSHRFRNVKSMAGVEIQEGSLQFDLEWPGTWDQWGWGKARGQIRGRVRRGALLGVKNSGAQLLNFLSLNFGDSAMERLRFNALELRFDIDRGNVSTPKSKCYIGTTFVRLQGKTNFISDRLELDALVTPNLTGKTIVRALSLISEEEEQAELERELYLTEPEGALSKTIRIRGTWANPKQD